ncbi:MAG: Ig-like domain-containing protein [Chitinophagaceae bacterium]|nr:Ig-like domain-containing protein [Chitinophagaceae bacterium]
MKKLFLAILLPFCFSLSTFSQVVINEVYGGGGNSGSTYTNDFIELYNNGASAQDLTGWSVQYASATGTTWQVTNLAGIIQPGQYFLIQEAAGAGGTTALPIPDVTGSISLSATAGKVILCNTTVAQSGANPATNYPGGPVIDKVGFGTTANGFETAAAPPPSNTNSIQRNSTHLDTDNNNSDFTAGAPTPTASGVVDITPPTIISFSPPDDALNVVTNSALSITFSEPVKKSTGVLSVNNSTTGTTDYVTFTSANTNVVVAGNTITIYGVNLQPSNNYYITIPDSIISDLAGNKFAGIANNTTWNFSTASTVATPIAGIINSTYTLNTSPNIFNSDGFTQYSVMGRLVWEATTFGNSSTNGLEMNGFYSGTNQLNEDWFISPAFDLTATTFPLLSFYSINKFNGDPLQLKVSTNYPGYGNPNNYTWADVNGKFPPQASNVWTLSNNINLSAYKSANTYFALVYTSSNDDGQRWTLDDIRLDDSPTPPPPTLSLSTADVQFNYVAVGGNVVKTISITGNDITGDITLNAPPEFTLSGDGVSFTSSLTLTQPTSNNVTRTLYIQFSPTQSNKNYTDSILVNTPGVAITKIYVKGSTIDPANTLEIVNWNLEWFGSPTLGPTDDNLQKTNVETITKNIAADLYAVVEVVSEPELQDVVSNLNAVYGAGTYAYVLCDYGSHVNPFETPPPTGTLADAQKEAFIYKTSLFSNISTTALLSLGVNTAADLSNPDYNYWASGRYPYMMTADVTLNGITKNIHFVLIHAKANTSPTITSYNRRKSGATDLHNYLNTTYPNDNIIILGDFNDDLDSTITDGIVPKITSYSSFTADNINFFSPTLALSLAGKASTVKYSDVIDHVYLSNEMAPYYLSNTASILTDQAALIPSYGTTTTDHYPVFTRYAFDLSVLPVKLLSFTAQKNGEKVNLNWKTSNEINTKYFIVERSADGNYWQSFATVSAGTNTNGNAYTVTDNFPLSGINYYRLKQVDVDNKFAYSEIRNVSFGTKASVIIFPNPAKDFLHIVLTKSNNTPVIIQLQDVSGKIISQFTTNENLIKIDIRKFSAGTYFVKVIGDNIFNTQKFLIQ